ncbi:MAG: SLC13 family permease [Gammaproteobacteria bacterium]|nr:SLC13 family permease [Gammaproteobacteria bacterium]HRX72062.1 SLC13 family permease [Candidatus Competibacteraceae bacterium]
MGWEAWFTGGLIVTLMGILATTRAAPDMVFLGGLILLVLVGIVPAPQAFEGLANQGVITVGALYVVVAGLRETGGVQWLVQRVLGRPESLSRAQLRLMLPVTVLSAFLNNTPVVGMLIPAVSEWARKYQLPVSKLMLPLSYAAILGGTCTLIGTSTNLVVNGLLIDRAAINLRMFDITAIGLPVAIAGLAFLILTSRWLLPSRQPPVSPNDDPRRYTLEMLVEPNGPLVSKTIESAGLRHLPGCYLMEIDRDGAVLPAVSPRETLRGGDRLVFVGVVDSVVDLQRIRGLTPAASQVFKLAERRSNRLLVEAVVSNTCPLVGHSIRDGRFRNRYKAVVIAVARNGARLRGKIGDIVLRPGDILLVEAGIGFLEVHRNNQDFFLVSPVPDSTPLRHERALLALSILGAMVLLAGVGLLDMFEAALSAATLMLLTRCVSIIGARQSIDWSVLLVIAAAFGIGGALQSTELALNIATAMVNLAGDSPVLNLVMIYLATVMFTAVINNNAAALLMFPIAQAATASLDTSIIPFAMAIMMAASAEFSTPIGYQTNLMVYGPGGYRFSDYLRVGLPLNGVVGCVSLGMILWLYF